jgi:hypothetical protein
MTAQGSTLEEKREELADVEAHEIETKEKLERAIARRQQLIKHLSTLDWMVSMGTDRAMVDLCEMPIDKVSVESFISMRRIWPHSIEFEYDQGRKRMEIYDSNCGSLTRVLEAVQTDRLQKTEEVNTLVRVKRNQLAKLLKQVGENLLKLERIQGSLVHKRNRFYRLLPQTISPVRPQGKSKGVSAMKPVSELIVDYIHSSNIKEGFALLKRAGGYMPGNRIGFRSIFETVFKEESTKISAKVKSGRKRVSGLINELKKIV